MDEMLKHAVKDNGQQDKSTSTVDDGMSISECGIFCLKIMATCKCTILRVVLEKNSEKKALGFTIVGGKDSSKGPMGIYIKTMAENGQAYEQGNVREGDEIIGVNGNSFSEEITITQALNVIRKFKNTTLVMYLSRRVKNCPHPYLILGDFPEYLSGGKIIDSMFKIGLMHYIMFEQSC